MIELTKDQRLERLPKPPDLFKAALLEQLAAIKAATNKSPELAWRWACKGVRLCNPLISDPVLTGQTEDVRIWAAEAEQDPKCAYWLPRILDRVEAGETDTVVDAVIALAGDLGGSVLWGQTINQMYSVVLEAAEAGEGAAYAANIQIAFTKGF